MEVNKTLNSLEENLRRHVYKLSHGIGERNIVYYEKLEEASEYIKNEFESYGYEVEVQKFKYEGRTFKNIIAIHDNYSDEKTVIIGAHYDSVLGSPGADDNASGVGVLLELSRLLRDEHTPYKVSFVAFPNEEPPFFATDGMGSYRYAKKIHEEGKEILGMICLESVGYYREEPGSQRYPVGLSLFYPSEGNFIAIVGNLKSRSFGKRIVRLMKEVNLIKVESLFLPPSLLPEIELSDNYPFYQFGYPALMFTDTAFLRNPNYHLSSDTYESLDYQKMSYLTYALSQTLPKMGRQPNF